MDLIEQAQEEMARNGRPRPSTSEKLLSEVIRLRDKIEEAKNCLVVSAIGDPMEVCTNTLAILEDTRDS